MRGLLIGLFALNLLQAGYIFSTQQSTNLIKETKPPAAASASLSNTTKQSLETNQVNPQAIGVSVLSKEIRLVSRKMVNDLVESGKALNTVRFSLWPKGGFLATYVKQTSVIARLGLMKGDVVKSINNTQMSSVLHALSIYQDLEELHFLELGIERQGKAISYFYKLID